MDRFFWVEIHHRDHIFWLKHRWHIQGKGKEKIKASCYLKRLPSLTPINSLPCLSIGFQRKQEDIYTLLQVRQKIPGYVEMGGKHLSGMRQQHERPLPTGDLPTRSPIATATMPFTSHHLYKEMAYTPPWEPDLTGGQFPTPHSPTLERALLLYSAYIH